MADTVLGTGKMAFKKKKKKTLPQEAYIGVRGNK